MSTKGRYGARAMLDIAMHDDKGPVSLRDLAQRQELSVKYLEQLIKPLKAAGLIKSVRGAGGGYVLAKEPFDINLLQIIEALEKLATSDCLDNPRICGRVAICATHDVWKEIQNSTTHILASLTLQDMVEKQRRKLA